MSAQEIIAELPKLPSAELRLVQQRLAELQSPSTPPPAQPKTGWGRALLEVEGAADDLPADLSVNHDHYLYGTPKQQSQTPQP